MLGMCCTSKCFELLRMDLMGPIEVASLGGKRYVLVCADAFSRYTWVEFLQAKSDAFFAFKKLYNKFRVMFAQSVVRIRTDHGKEFENSTFSDFCAEKGITHEFSAPKTPQQNGVAERKNRTLQEMVRVMLYAKNLSKRLWAEAVNTTCHIINRVYLRPGTSSTPYEILKGKKPNLKYFHVFGCVCYILNVKEHLSKFDARSDKGMFLGYALNSQAYRVYNLKTKTIQESMNVVFDDTADLIEKAEDIDLTNLVEDRRSASTDVPAQENQNVAETSEPTSSPPPISSSGVFESDSDNESDDLNFLQQSDRRDAPGRIRKDHPASQIIGGSTERIQTRKKSPVSYRDMVIFACMLSVINSIGSSCFLSNFEPKNVVEALKDELWINDMHDELNQFVRHDVWELVPKPSEKNVIGTQWIFKN